MRFAFTALDDELGSSALAGGSRRSTPSSRRSRVIRSSSQLGGAPAGAGRVQSSMPAIPGRDRSAGPEEAGHAPSKPRKQTHARRMQGGRIRRSSRPTIELAAGREVVSTPPTPGSRADSQVSNGHGCSPPVERGVNLQLGPSPGVQKAMNRVNAAEAELDPEHFQRPAAEGQGEGQGHGVERRPPPRPPGPGPGRIVRVMLPHPHRQSGPLMSQPTKPGRQAPPELERTMLRGTPAGSPAPSRRRAVRHGHRDGRRRRGDPVRLQGPAARARPPGRRRSAGRRTCSGPMPGLQVALLTVHDDSKKCDRGGDPAPRPPVRDRPGRGGPPHPDRRADLFSRHVEITLQTRRRDPPAGSITGLQSTLGMFVRVSRTALADKAEFLVGNGRYRLDIPQAGPGEATGPTSSPRQRVPTGETRRLGLEGPSPFRPPRPDRIDRQTRSATGSSS